MADFYKYVSKTLKFEGGYQNRIDDNGNYCYFYKNGSRVRGQRVGTNHGISAQAFQDAYGKCPTIAEMQALTQAQGELRNPPKDSINPHYKNRYADLATVLDTIRPVLAKHKMAVMQIPCTVDGSECLATMLVHESGEFIRATTRLNQIKNDPQGIGSAMTYARRYGLQSLLAIAADDDDDGNSGYKPSQKTTQPAPKNEQPKPATLDDDAIKTLKLLLKQKGWVWAKAIEAINSKFTTAYTPKTTPKEMLCEHVIEFGKWLMQQPDKVSDKVPEAELDWSVWLKRWGTKEPGALTWEVVQARCQRLSHQ
jgi:hypothetical protein